jgi:AcrR family transcriptional regulator
MVLRMSPPAGPFVGESTRQRILDVALELFAAQGFAATTTRELSERLGFTKAALYYHFHSKDDLLQALVEPVMAELSGLLARYATTPADDAVRAAVLADYLDVLVRHRRLIGVLVQDPSVAGRPAIQAGQEYYLRLTGLLSGSADTAEDRARIRFVLGGLHATVLFAEPGEPLDVVRTTALAAGHAALGTRSAGAPD